jgi:hypothetical protein
MPLAVAWTSRHPKPDRAISAPKVQCTVTDKYSAINVYPTLKITGQSSHSLGKSTASAAARPTWPATWRAR